MSTELLVDFRSVTKLYGNVIGVNDFDLQLPPGAYGLLGPNGAGKSTLLNLMIGQLRPSRGAVRVLGCNPVNNPSLLSRIGFCPGFEGMYAAATGISWVTLLLELHGWDSESARERARECLVQVGMHDAMNRLISEYSRGMRQRTKLAQAIAHRPELLILDEPFSGLDPIGRAEITDYLRQWIDNGGNLIIASHVLHEIESLTDSFLLISGGRLLASGNAGEVQSLMYDVPAEITISCSNARRLAARLLENDLADSVRLIPQRDAEPSLRVATRQLSGLCEELPVLVRSEGLVLRSVHAGDDSLQTLFTSLMRMHRGEL